MDTKTKIMAEMGAITPRDHDFSADNWHNLSEREQERFAEMYQQEVKQLPETVQQAIMLRGGMASGLTIAAAFKRYVRGEEHWVR